MTDYTPALTLSMATLAVAAALGLMLGLEGHDLLLLPSLGGGLLLSLLIAQYPNSLLSGKVAAEGPTQTVTPTAPPPHQVAQAQTFIIQYFRIRRGARVVIRTTTVTARSSASAFEWVKSNSGRWPADTGALRILDDSGGTLLQWTVPRDHV